MKRCQRILAACLLLLLLGSALPLAQAEDVLTGVQTEETPVPTYTSDEPRHGGEGPAVGLGTSPATEAPQDGALTAPPDGDTPQDGTPTAPPEPDTTEPPEPTPGDARLPWMIASGVLAVGLLGALTLLLLRRAKRDVVEEPVEVEAFTGMITDFSNLHHIGRRESQQDAFGVSSLADADAVNRRGVLAIVADGMGGLSNSGEVSQLVVQTLLQSFAALPTAAPGGDLLLQLVATAHEKVLAQFGTAGKSGTTLVAVHCQKGMLSYVSIGDSRIGLIRGGALLPLNRQHTYGMELDEQAARGELNLATAKANTSRHALTSYLGMRDLKYVDWSQLPIPLCKGDQVILMSDGVFGTVPDAQIVEALSGGASGGAELLEQQILAKGKANQDNFTAIILQW